MAKFCAFYPGEFQSGAIPWVLFWTLYHRLHVVLAVHRVNMTQAGQLAQGYEGAAMKIQSDIREAHGG